MARPSLWSRLTSRPQSQVDVSGEMVLREILAQYDVVEVVPGENPYMVVSERSADKQLMARTGDVSFAEMGSSSPSPFISDMRDEYNAKLRGLNGLRVYDQMRKSDGTIGGTLRMMKTPVLAARWFVEPASDSSRDVKIAEFIQKCLMDYQSISWTQLLTEIMLMLDFGYYMFEKVFDVKVIDGEPRVVWAKLAPRHPMDVKKWHKDANGGPRGIEFYGMDGYTHSQPVNAAWMSTSVGEAVAGAWATPYGQVSPDPFIPMDKMLIFSYQREAGNLQGVSVLRPAYKHWYFIDQLYKIDAIQKERHGIGIPVIKLPVGFTPDDRRLADELGRNLRTNERAHVVLPPNWELLFAKIEGQPVNAMTSIEHHAARIRESIIAKFLGDDSTTQKEDQYMFLKSERYLADLVCDTFNTYAIRQLVDYNFQRLPNGYPKLRARGIGEDEDQRTFSFTLRNLVGAGIITPDDRLEQYVREFLDLPGVDVATRRQVAQPQDPNAEEEDESPRTQGQQAGMPRQQAVVGPFGVPRGNAGTDRSGG